MKMMLTFSLLAFGMYPLADASQPPPPPPPSTSRLLVCGDGGGGKYKAGTGSSNYRPNYTELATMATDKPFHYALLYAQGSVGGAYAYGLALCHRHDADASACNACLAAALQDAHQRCKFHDGAAAFDTHCFLSFSSRPRLVVVVNSGSGHWTDFAQTTAVLPGWDLSDAGSVARIASTVKLLLQDTAMTAAYVRSPIGMYATAWKSSSVTFPKLYSLAHCAPELTSRACWTCLKNIIETAVESFAGSSAGTVIGMLCYIKYDTYQFYHDEPLWHWHLGSSHVVVQPALVTPASPTRHTRSMRKVLVIGMVIALPVLFICSIVTFVLVTRNRKVKGSPDMTKKNVSGTLVRGPEERSSDFRIYNFSQVLDATSNFSEENKLGQGGFGPVYKMKQEKLC